MLIFEKFKKNKLINSLREEVMFVVDKVNNLQERNQALRGQLDESKLKMQKVSKTSSEIIRKLQVEKDEVVKDKMAIIQHLKIEKDRLQAEKDDVVKEKMVIIQHLEIEKEQLTEISHMQSEEITTLTNQLEKSRKMLS